MTAASRDRRLRLGVLFGGRSTEHEVSVVSARSILREADPARLGFPLCHLSHHPRFFAPSM